MMYPNINININEIKGGKVVSSKEVLEDVTPVNWSEEVLTGKYRDTPIIKSPEEKGVQLVKKIIRN